jgi:hypothetical protein
MKPKPKPKPKPKSNTTRQSFKLTESDNELIKQLMEKYSLPNKTLAHQYECKKFYAGAVTLTVGVPQLFAILVDSG